jgi:hypothetical protein
MRSRLPLLLLLVAASTAGAQDLVLEGDLDADAPPYTALAFDVPEGTVELEVRHDDLSEANILDWGLADPERVRGWGGGNTEPAIVGAEAASRSYRPGAIQAGEWQVLVGQALVEDPPARYRVEVFFRDAPTLDPMPERSPYDAAAALESGPRWYAGDFHVHSRESGDARATLDESADLAAERGLDFIELSEHNTVSVADLLNDAQDRHPDVLLMPGIEVTTYFGHGNSMGVSDFVDFRVRSELGVDLASVLAETEAAGGLFAINHPVLDIGNLCLGCDWVLDTPPEGIDAVEIQNGAYSLTGTLFYRDALAFWDAILDAGGRAAAIGGSDDHRAGIDLDGLQSPIGSPTTMVYADALSVDAILAAVRAGRTVVKLEGPDDPMVELFAGDAMVGDTVSGPVTLRAVVTGASSGTLAFVRNGELARQVDVDGDPFEATLEVEAPYGDTDDRWRAQLSMPRPRVVTSHLWVRATGEPAPPDAGPGGGSSGGGCGCRAANGAGGSWPLLLVLAWARRRTANPNH